MKPIYVNKEHEIIIEKYLDTVCSFAEQCASKPKYLNYLDVLDSIIEYHNEYKISTHTGNWLDFLLIIPINVTTMTNGFFAGIENKRNIAQLRTYQMLLSEIIIDVISKLRDIKPTSE